MKTFNFVKKRLQPRCHPVNIEEFLGTPILMNDCFCILFPTLGKMTKTSTFICTVPNVSFTAWPSKSKHRLQSSPFYLWLFSSFFSFSFKYIIMVFTRSQTENMSRDELVEELLKLPDVLTKLSELTEKFNNFLSKHGKVYSEFQISRNCNNHLLQRIIQLERNVMTNSQYHRR